MLYFLVKTYYNIVNTFLKGVFDMAKKIGKALIFTAVAGAIAAGGVALYNKYKASTDDFDDDFLDFDDEDEDFDDDSSSDREYVSIPRDNETDDLKSETSDKETNSDYKVNVNIDTSGFSMEEDNDYDDTDDVSVSSVKSKSSDEI